STGTLKSLFGSLVDISVGIGFTFGGDVIWKLADPDVPDLETPFSQRSEEEQKFRGDEMVDLMTSAGSIWATSGDFTDGLNIYVSVTLFHIPVFSKVINLVTFKIADWNYARPTISSGTVTPLAHLSYVSLASLDPNAGSGLEDNEVNTLFLNTSLTSNNTFFI